MQKGLKKYFVNMDEYLCSLGLYRKMVARDASSLFRAVSEQLYSSQNHHQKIRQDCANFMRANRCNFEPFVEGSFEKYLERLEDPKVSRCVRRCFVIYRYPGKQATVISEDDYVDKVILCCSINGHYDIVYQRSYPASAALCQSLVYELLYTQVFGLEEAELCQAVEAFRVGGRRYRNSPSMCSDVDAGYDMPEEQGQREESEVGRAIDEKPRLVSDEAPPSCRLCLPYKVMKSLDGDVYRNLEFDVWQDTCKEMQKTDYMVFAGRQYFLGDKCQVRLQPKGKYYNAFIQEVGTHPSAVTVFIEELGEKHLVPLTDLKPVNPVPAWNITVSSHSSDPELRGPRHHRHRYFRKSRGSHPRPPPPPSPGAMAYDPYAPHHHHPPTTRPPRYGANSSTRFLNRHLIGPQLTYYHPGRRYYHDYENYAFRSRRSRRHLAALNKDCAFGFPGDAVDESADLESAMAFYQLDDGGEGSTIPPPSAMGAPHPPAGSTYRVQRSTGPLPHAPAPGNTPVCSSEEEQGETSTVEDQGEYAEDFIYSSQGESHSTAYLLPILMLCCVSVVAMPIPAASPWLVNELGEPVCSVMSPPPYSYDPNGSDLPRDYRVLQYYYNLGVQVRSLQPYSSAPPETPYSYQHYPPYASQDAALHGENNLLLAHVLPAKTNNQQTNSFFPAAPQGYPDAGRGPHQPPSSFPESSRADGQTDTHNSGWCILNTNFIK
uniref:ubiquitinyl hydrolase 1 n=1 Tax=Sphaeramia orbicularis TaxID=375764 RepID=A0A672ZXU3_9TELE